MRLLYSRFHERMIGLTEECQEKRIVEPLKRLLYAFDEFEKELGESLATREQEANISDDFAKYFAAQRKEIICEILKSTLEFKKCKKGSAFKKLIDHYLPEGCLVSLNE